MDEQAVRTSAEAFCEALVAGDVDRAIESMSPELRRNLGEVLTLFPLPATAAEIDSIDRGGASISVTLRLTGETEEVMVQTRWKDRDGQPTIVETSHLSRTAAAEPEPAEDEPGSQDTSDT